MFDWFDNLGEAKVRTRGDLGDRSVAKIRELYRIDGPIMFSRVGRFSTVTFANSFERPGYYEPDQLLAAPIYSEPIMCDSIKPGSEFWEDHKGGRIRVCGHVLGIISHKHPHYKALRDEAYAELKYLMES